jgi:hypothetical protein
LARTSADAPATGTGGSDVMVAVAAYDRMRETHVHDDSCCLTIGIGKLQPALSRKLPRRKQWVPDALSFSRHVESYISHPEN